MRRWSIAVVASLGLAAPATADTISVLKQNTLVLHEADGGFYAILLKDDELEQINPAGMWARGIWSVTEEGGFCWTARGASTLCIPMPADRKVGDRWEVRGPTGKLAWTAEIQPGRADLDALGRGVKAPGASKAAADTGE